jgi:Flp pilus assembly protein TadB
MSRHKTVRRAVRSDDPSLTPEANRLLTEELREIVGADEVEVPAGTPDERRAPHAERSTVLGTIQANKVLFAISLLALLVVGVILSLVTGSWWALVAALAVHAVGTLLVTTVALRMTSEVEHVDPATSARLQEEGVADPDRLVTDLASEFAGEQEATRAAEIVSTGRNDNRADPLDEPARATAEQRTAMTPSARRSSPAGSGTLIGAMPLAVVVGVLLVALVVAITQGGWLWLMAAVVWAAGAAWLFVVRRVDGRAEERAARDDRPPTGGPGRAPGDRPSRGPVG